MLKVHLAAAVLTTGTLVSPPWPRSTQAMPGGLNRPQIVTATESPAGTETLAVQWFRVAVPDVGIMVAAVARPLGAGPRPVVLLLHGTHGLRASTCSGPRIGRAVASSPSLGVGFQAEAGPVRMR